MMGWVQVLYRRPLSRALHVRNETKSTVDEPV